MLTDCLATMGFDSISKSNDFMQTLATHNKNCGTEHGVAIGGWYRHFKGSVAKVLNLAKHSETAEYLVIYECVCSGTDGSKCSGGIYARPLEMFLSKVDSVKYPNCTQQFRFELIE